MKIVLTGYMGSGKSTVGRKLADQMELSFIDLDDYLEIRIGKTIPEIFREKGEIYFRKMEHECLREILSEKEGFILATGGGTPCYSGNMDLILQNTPHVFYLQLSVASLSSRLASEKAKRPLIQHLREDEIFDFIGKHLFERLPFYAMSTHTISCDSRSLEEVVSSIKSLLI